MTISRGSGPAARRTRRRSGARGSAAGAHGRASADRAAARAAPQRFAPLPSRTGIQFLKRRIRTFRTSPNPISVAMIDEPPKLISGSVSPLTGARPAAIVML